MKVQDWILQIETYERELLSVIVATKDMLSRIIHRSRFFPSSVLPVVVCTTVIDQLISMLIGVDRYFDPSFDGSYVSFSAPMQAVWSRKKRPENAENTLYAVLKDVENFTHFSFTYTCSPSLLLCSCSSHCSTLFLFHFCPTSVLLLPGFYTRPRAIWSLLDSHFYRSPYFHLFVQAMVRSSLFI